MKNVNPNTPTYNTKTSADTGKGDIWMNTRVKEYFLKGCSSV
jgi:hypothetical protein